MRRSRGQALIEFAFLAPVLMLLIFGMIDLGRGFYYQTEVTDAARDAARVAIGYDATPEASADDSDSAGGCVEETTCDTDDEIGPGLNAICHEAERDLTNIGVANVGCQLATGAPPFNYTSPAANQATVLVWCGTSSDCQTPNPTGSGTACDTASSPHTCIAVGIAYTFSILTPQIKQLGGPTLLIADSGQMVTLW